MHINCVSPVVRLVLEASLYANLISSLNIVSNFINKIDNGALLTAAITAVT